MDIGANLTCSQYQGMYHSKRLHKQDLDQVFMRSANYGVNKVVITVAQPRDIKFANNIADQYSNTYMTVGVHPTNANLFNNQVIEQIKQQFLNPKVVLYGEFGLDYDRLQFCNKETQISCFKAQLQLAVDSGRPMFLHCRNAYTDFFQIFVEFQNKTNRRLQGVMHSFTGNTKELQQILSQTDLYISVNGCSFKTEEQLKTMSLIPLNKLILETDCPYCTITQSYAGFKYVKTHFQNIKDAEKYESGCLVKGRNEPCGLVQVAEVMQELLKMDSKQIIEIGEANGKKLCFDK